MAAAAVTACIQLAGCNAEQAALVLNSKANKPLPQKLITEIEAKEMDPQSPILIRLFKQEAELEVWKQNRSGRFALLQTYPICRWSGELGPKVKGGDRQAPEGFYSVAPAQMNPESQYHLSFNLGYPNAYDRSLGRTGAHLMVHGDCSSAGCYAMTDEYISEIYGLGRESFFGGQRSFQVQAYPFRMTAQNMAKHRDNPNMPFWKMLKQGNDHFEVTQLEPKVDVCEQRYVFNADKDHLNSSPTFIPGGKCPAYQVRENIERAVAEKQRKDEHSTAELITRGTPKVVARKGIDGGMHALFAAKTPNGNTGYSDAKNYSVATYAAIPAVPSTVNPPASPYGSETVASLATNDGDSTSMPGSAAARASAKPQVAPVHVASATSSVTQEFFSNLARKIGIGGSDATTSATPTPKQISPPKNTPVVRPTKSAVPKGNDVRTAAKPADELPEREPETAGAQPALPGNSFEGRWSLR